LRAIHGTARNASKIDTCHCEEQRDEAIPKALLCNLEIAAAGSQRTPKAADRNDNLKERLLQP